MAMAARISGLNENGDTIKLPQGALMVHQERAYTSPV